MNIPQFIRTAAALMTVTAIASATPVPVPSQFAMNSGGFRAGSGDSELAVVFTVLAMPNIFSGFDALAAVPVPPVDLANLHFGNPNPPHDAHAPLQAGLPVATAAIAVPEPAPVALLALGLTALGVARRRAARSYAGT